jgi:hypothetical protein
VLIGVPILLGCLAVSGVGHANASEPKWTTRGCVVAQSLELGASSAEGRDGKVLITLRGRLADSVPVDPLTGAPPYYINHHRGTLTLTLRVLSERRDDVQWTRLARLGFDTSAMNDPGSDPIKAETGVNVVESVGSGTGAGQGGRVSTRLTVNPAQLRAQELGKSYASYALVGAELELTNSSDDPWCTVKVTASRGDPIAEFDVLPSKAEVDAAIAKTRDAAKRNNAGDSNRAVLVGVSIAVLLGASAGVAGALIRRRRKATAPPP